MARPVPSYRLGFVVSSDGVAVEVRSGTIEALDLAIRRTRHDLRARQEAVGSQAL